MLQALGTPVNKYLSLTTILFFDFIVFLSVFPIIRLPMQVHDRHNPNMIFKNATENSIWEFVGQAASRFRINWSPCIRVLTDSFDGCIYFFRESKPIPGWGILHNIQTSKSKRVSFTFRPGPNTAADIGCLAEEQFLLEIRQQCMKIGQRVGRASGDE